MRRTRVADAFSMGETRDLLYGSELFLDRAKDYLTGVFGHRGFHRYWNADIPFWRARRDDFGPGAPVERVTIRPNLKPRLRLSDPMALLEPDFPEVRSLIYVSLDPGPGGDLVEKGLDYCVARRPDWLVKLSDVSPSSPRS
jgi:hypothetical protein